MITVRPGEVRRIGSGVLVGISDGDTILVSLGEIVGCSLCGHFFVSDVAHGKATQSAIDRWLDGAPCTRKPRNFFKSLALTERATAW